MTDQGPLDPFLLSSEELGLATDLYEVTMAAAYFARQGVADHPRASFEYFVRGLPEGRNFLVFAGLPQLLASLEAFRFTADQVEYLRQLPVFGAVPGEFFDLLARFRFAADVFAMEEGSVFFPGEPVVRVTGSLLEAQLVETLLLSILNFQSAVASKAARIRLAAGEASLAEFGGRRAHGPQAAAWVARASYLAGFDATSNVLAGYRLGIPVVGTMAHSYIMSFDREVDAFRHFSRLFPEHTTLLVDTYDTLEGIRTALEAGIPFQGVRLDSGDLAKLARAARRLLDDHGHQGVKIFASSDLDEYRIQEFRREGAPIDAYGVGTRLAAVADTPYLSGVYKVVAVDEGQGWEGRRKGSKGKVSYPGRKQVLRTEVGGTFQGDRVVLAREIPEGLLIPVMKEGAAIHHLSLEASRQHCRQHLESLPEALRSLEPAEPYPVAFDRGLLEKVLQPGG